MPTPNDQKAAINEVAEFAKSLIGAGISIIPVKVDGSKAPAVAWKQFQGKRASKEEIDKWFQQERGIAIIGGKASGNLEILDFDEPKKFPEWSKLVQECDKKLFSKLVVVETPSGGFHVYYRSQEPVDGNQKLAQREEDGKRKTLIETRGEGGYVLAPGSPPQCHQLNKPYVLKQGKLSQIATLKVEERQLLLSLARSLNEFIEPERIVGGSVTENRGAKNRPGDEFDEKATWEDILKPHGWKYVRRGGQIHYWRRPNKRKGGPSATTNYADSGLLYVFSSNADPFEPERAYTKFAAHTFLNHKGNFKAAAKELAAQRYGGSPDQVNNYEMTKNGIVHWRSVKDGRISVPLTNFKAKILTDVVEDDGVDQNHKFELETELNGRRKRFTISSSDFSSMTWVPKNLGARAVIYAGFSAKDHARVAIQVLSGAIGGKTVYTHTGWRQVDQQWIYIHGGGAIGAKGTVPQIEVDLLSSLREYVLPSSFSREKLREAVLASLRIFEIAPTEITYPLLASIFRSVLGNNQYSIHLAGPTGTGKSEIAALAQQHFGAGLNARNLPGNWSSTDNYIEAQAYAAKDAVLVIDDFAPSGSGYDIQRWHKKADRIIRAQGNRSGRGRMRSDTSMRMTKWPRGLMLSTGEDIPRMQSVRARTLILELSPKQLDWELLTICQNNAAAGLLCTTLAGFIQQMAGSYDTVQQKLKDRILEVREKATKSGMHKRTPEIVANLYVGLECFLDFAERVGAITAAENREHRGKGWQALGKAAQVQEQHQQATEPTQRFVELLIAAITSGKAYVAGADGSEPDNPKIWGWNRGQLRIGEGPNEPAVYDWHSRGDRIGWVDKNGLYLEPQAAFAIAQRMGRGMGDELQVGNRTLHKRLKEKGLLKSCDSLRNRLTIHKSLAESRRVVLHLDSRVLMQEETAQTAQVTQSPENRDSSGTVRGTETIQ